MPDDQDLPEALARLVALGRSPDINIRPVLLRVVIDLFIQKEHHAPADLQQFEAIVSHLLDDADVEARLIVAEKLSRHPATPKALVDRFVAESGIVARAAYANAPLDRATLDAAAVWGSADIAAVVARRPDLSAAAVAALAERSEPEVLRELAGNEHALIDRASFQHLVRVARDDRKLAERLVDKQADPIDLAPLFPIVSGERRRAIIEAARRLDLGKRSWGRHDLADAATLAQMDRLVRCGERDSFEHMLCVALGADWTALLPLLHDPGGEILALALAAIGASPEFGARVFILGDPVIARSLARVRALAEIVETVPPHAARRLIGAMTGSPAQRATPIRQPATTRRMEPPLAAETPVRTSQPAELPARRRG